MSKLLRSLVVVGVLLLMVVVPAIAEFDNVLVSDVYYDIYILDALSNLSVISGVPIIADSSVGGFITMEFEDIPLEDALGRICVPFGYTYRYMSDGYYLVGAANVNNPTFSLLSETFVCKTNFVTAETVAKLLSDFYKPFVKVDNTLNTLVVTGSPEMIERISQDISRIDTPIRQVILEVLVIELTDDARRELGTEWQWSGKKEKGDPSSGGLEFVVSALRAKSAIAYNYPAGITSFLLSLKPMVEQGKAKIHANPRIVALDGHQADIFLGQEQSYIVETQSSTGGLTKQRVIIQSGVTLNFLPQISPLGDVTVKVEPEVSQITGFNQDGYPIVSSRRAKTTVRVQDGETFVLGGLVNKFESSSIGKIPLLGDIPLIGKLFRSERIESSETEVIIMITPHIIESEV
ncbi:MAG: type II secretion system protein GspD [Firmicutes bacterium]|nr:type II secretion system protein GspD [Bacillota bacterium]